MIRGFLPCQLLVRPQAKLLVSINQQLTNNSEIQEKLCENWVRRSN